MKLVITLLRLNWNELIDDFLLLTLLHSFNIEQLVYIAILNRTITVGSLSS